jgi:ABC-type antimicrobial peptide transport system permease subunit
VVSEAVGPLAIAAGILGMLGLGALLLAGMGIYGVVSYAVERRTHEIGVRMAFGAEQRDIFRLILRQGLILASIGLSLGLLVVFGASRVLLLVPGVEDASDPVMFFGTTILLLFISLLAAYLPARRAARVEPLVSLRYE